MYMADFETTVYDGQTSTEVWAAALVKIGTEDVVIYHALGKADGHLIALLHGLQLGNGAQVVKKIHALFNAFQGEDRFVHVNITGFSV